MVFNNKIFAWAALSSVVIFIASLSAFPQLLALLEPNIEGIVFVIKGNVTAFFFSAGLALIPVLVVATWRISRITLLHRKILSVLFVVSSIAAALFARHQQVKIFFNHVVRPLLLASDKKPVLYPIDPRNFSYYLIGGLLAGCCLSYLFLRQKKS